MLDKLKQTLYSVLDELVVDYDPEHDDWIPKDDQENITEEIKQTKGD